MVLSSSISTLWTPRRDTAPVTVSSFGRERWEFGVLPVTEMSPPTLPMISDTRVTARRLTVVRSLLCAMVRVDGTSMLGKDTSVKPVSEISIVPTVPLNLAAKIDGGFGNDGTPRSCSHQSSVSFGEWMVCHSGITLNQKGGRVFQAREIEGMYWVERENCESSNGLQCGKIQYA